MTQEQRTRWLRILALVFAVGLTLFLYLNRHRVQHLQGYGYAGIFLVSLLTNATLILPIPGVLITSAMGAVFNPFWVALAAGSGAALGELSGYLVGFSGQGIVERAQWHDRIEPYIRRYGGLAILVMAFVPNPAFDVAGIIAGALKMPLRIFLFWCWLGKVLKMLIFAYSGALLLGSPSPS
ncbi:VTT domain-containing protein [Thermanaerothrix daxensis]|uniref:VTT domain-containing protein n=1 Tax=Thermanaerothrix daxensis TaxID=869279 RepID=UPI0006C9302F|nr:VTT domain-containing protein [Thermanaerothrix daxensis]